MAQPNQSDVSLPENLQRQFTLLERRLWKVETAMAVCLGLSGLTLSYLVLFFSDRFWDSPGWFRALTLVLGLVVLGGAGLRWVKLWVLQRRDGRQLAMLVQAKFRRLGDRLLGIVELANEKQHAANFSPELYRAAIQQVAAEAEKYSFPEAIDKRAAQKLIGTTSGLLVFLALLAFVVPAASWNACQRWVAPFSATARYTLVKIAGVPSQMIVPHGENFQLTANISYESFWKPARTVARFANGFSVSAQVKEGQAIFTLPGQMQTNAVKISIGDACSELVVAPAHRPALKQMTATIQLPDYLKYPSGEEKIQSGTLTLLENSRVLFRGQISRELQSAALSDGKKYEVLHATGHEFISLPLVADGVPHFSFTWQDKLGLSNAAPWKLRMQTQRDQPPTPDLPELSRDVAILQTDFLQIKAVARDDYGIRDVGLSWEVFANGEEADGWAVTETKVERPSPRDKKAEETFQWSPIVYRIPEDASVELLAFTTDYFPGRERVESLPHRIHVLGREQHADLVRQNLESVLARVEEVARLQEKILAKTGELKDDEKLSPKEAGEKIEKTAGEQQQNAKHLDQLAQEGMTALQEAMKNPLFKEEMLQDWSKTMQQMQELAQEKMKKATGDLQSARQKSGEPQSKKQDLAQAEKKMEEIMEELEKVQSKVNKNLDDLQAMTLSERLRKLAETETGMADDLKKTIPETVGLLPHELPEKFKKRDLKLAKTQDETQKEAHTLQGEINRFYERTQKPNYGEVSQSMQEARTSEELERLRDMIQDNIAMEATRNLHEWAQRFQAWAEKLQPPSSEDTPPPGSGEGNPPPNLTKTLIALLRMREKEGVLHSQTQLLEKEKPTLKNYAESAQTLTLMQQSLRETLQEIAVENEIPMLAQPYQETAATMNAVEKLLQIPRTDTMTTAAEMKTVEALTDLINLINEQAQRNPPPPSEGGGENSAEDMAFLMQMLAPQPGQGEGMPLNQPGGNTRGGTTDRAAAPLTGETEGKGGEERRVHKASGAAGVQVPTEFRETLESYFKALEQEPN